MADGSADPFPMLGSVYRGPGSKFTQKGTMNYKQTSGNAQSSNSKAWGNPNVIQKPPKWGNGESQVGQGSNNNQLDLSKKNNSELEKSNEGKFLEPFCDNIAEEYDDESDNEITYSSDDDLSLDDTDNDSGEKYHEGWKKSKSLRNFFSSLNKLPSEEMNSEARTWHCPVCHGGVGAIDWYYGLQALLNHARTIKSRKARLHRIFADALEYECLMRKVPLTSFGETFGLWVGLDKNNKDHEIVWPAMVIVMNTRYQRDENNKWTGMGNQELLDSFSDYAALKARHAYGPQGHRGMGVLIFDTTTAGYLEAVRLHKHFKEQGRDREAWDHCKNPFVIGGKRQLYGYLATRDDLNIFNQHSGGKSRLKFEMRSYQEMVESKIKNINEDSQLLDYWRNMVAKEKRQSEVVAATLSKVSDKLRKTIEETRVVRERTKEQHQENKEEMNAQEQFFLDQIKVIHQAIDAKEEDFEKLQKYKREVKLTSEDSSEKQDDNHIMEGTSSFIISQDKDMRQFEEERDHILKIHEGKQLVLKKKQWQEQVELVKELENELTQLMSKYALSLQEEDSYKK